MPIKYRKGDKENKNSIVRTVLDDKNIWDVIYPVGTLYWTMTPGKIEDVLKAPSDMDWEWIKISGFVYAMNDNETNGDDSKLMNRIVGQSYVDSDEKEGDISKAGFVHKYYGIKLADKNLPPHTHTMSHTHTRGSMNITGDFSAQTAETYGTKSGAFSHNGESTKCDGGYSAGRYSNGIHFDASKTWTGNTSQPLDSDGNDITTTGSDGGGKAFDWLPPFITAYCWRRIR